MRIESSAGSLSLPVRGLVGTGEQVPDLAKHRKKTGQEFTGVGRKKATCGLHGGSLVQNRNTTQGLEGRQEQVFECAVRRGKETRSALTLDDHPLYYVPHEQSNYIAGRRDP